MAKLSRSRDFEQVYRQGQSRANRYLVLYSFPRGDQSEARFGVSVSRKVGGATTRNKIKRLLRECFSAESERFSIGHDYVVVGRNELAELAERDGLAAVKKALVELVESETKVPGGDGQL